MCRRDTQDRCCCFGSSISSCVAVKELLKAVRRDRWLPVLFCPPVSCCRPAAHAHCPGSTLGCLCSSSASCSRHAKSVCQKCQDLSHVSTIPSTGRVVMCSKSELRITSCLLVKIRVASLSMIGDCCKLPDSAAIVTRIVLAMV